MDNFIQGVWHPLIDYDKCSACGLCYELCPKGVYKKEKNKIVVMNPNLCVNKCHGCEWRCPKESISFPEEFTKEYGKKVIRYYIEKNKEIPKKLIQFIIKNKIMLKEELNDEFNLTSF